jgi:hypothetical protein
MKINQSKLDTLIEETEKTLTVYRSIKSVMRKNKDYVFSELHKMRVSNGLCWYCAQNEYGMLHSTVQKYSQDAGIVFKDIGFTLVYIIAPLFDEGFSYKESFVPRIEFLETVLQECKKLKKATK